MRKVAAWLTTCVVATGMACSNGDDMAGPAWPPGGATYPPSDGDGDDGGSAGESSGEADDGGTDGGAAEGPVPPADDGADAGTDGGVPPPPSDDGDPPPPPPPADDGGMPPATTPNCQAYCDTIDSCGWIVAPDTVQDCYFGCSEPYDMGPCDAAWDMLAGCLGALDCAGIEMFDAGQSAACQAEAQATDQACAGIDGGGSGG